MRATRVGVRDGVSQVDRTCYYKSYTKTAPQKPNHASNTAWGEAPGGLLLA